MVLTPYANSLTSRLIAEPDFWILPRKFKISFSNSKDDNANTTINDLVFIACVKNCVKRFRDYRGIACPMNFINVKLDLSTMTTGQILRVLLDNGEPIENVPGSVIDEGHEIVEQKKSGDYWSVIIKKG